MTEATLEGIKTAGILLLAAIAGGLGYVRKELAMGRKLTFYRILFAIILATFFAYLINIVCKKFGLDDDWARIVIGVMSYIGPDFTIQLLERIVLNKLGIKYGYFPVNTAEKVPSTIGSVDYLRADVFPTPVEAREHAVATANNGDNSATNGNAEINKQPEGSQ